MKIPLSPLRFLQRAAAVHPDRTAIIDGPRSLTYRAMTAQVTRLAQALTARGLRPGDRVAYLAPNCAEMLVAHFAVPLAGGVLVTLNTRLSPSEIAQIVEHSGAEFLLGDAPLLQPAQEDLSAVPSLREIVTLPGETGEAMQLAGTTSYLDLLIAGSDEPLPYAVPDEDDAISLNYTSGTTGDPKGVVYTHRGAYLNALGEVIHQGFRDGSSYLWTLPMFHCNGWCTTWALTAVAGTHVCLRAVRADDIWRLIDEAGVTHMAGAPTVLSMMSESPLAHPLRRPLTVTTAGAPPSPTIIEVFADLNVRVVHVYGLTETYGPYTVCEEQDSWSALPVAERSRLKSRQGVGMVTADEARVVATSGDPDQLVDVPADGVTMGEIVMRGNTVMKEYFRDPDGTGKCVPRRLVPLRGSGRAVPRRLRPAAGSGEGHRHLRWREHLHHRGGERADVPSGRQRRRRHRRPGPAVGRAAEGVRGAGRGPARRPGRTDRPRQDADREVQGTQVGRFRSGSTQDFDRKAP